MTDRSDLTRRDLLKRGAVFGGAVMWSTPVVQAIGMTPALAATPSDACVAQWASSVVDASQGTAAGGGAIRADRSDPANALGPNDGTFFSLGFPNGSITVGFARDALPDTGAEVIVIETTSGSYPLETARVEVSPNGSDFVAVGTATNIGRGASSFSMAGIAHRSIRYVRITNTTDPSLFAGRPKADGFDVNAVGVGCP